MRRDTVKEEIEILYEDKDILVCVKPHGLPTQSKNIRITDVERWGKNHVFQENPGKSPYIAVIHRLDQPVKGILVLGKNKKAAGNLSRQLQTGSFGKYYMAKVEGVPAKPEGDLVNFMVKNGRENTSMICEKERPEAKEARLHYQVLEIEKDSSLLEIHLDTGRHHQIRVQMAHMGNPLMGDVKYNTRTQENVSKSVLCLCAYKLEFRHPMTGKVMRFQLGPEEWW